MFLLYSIIICLVISNNITIDSYSFKILIIINYTNELFLYLKLQQISKQLDEITKKFMTFYTLYNTKSKQSILTDTDKQSIHNQIIILNKLINYIKNNNLDKFYTTIHNQLCTLYELRSLSLTPYYEFNYMLSLHKVKLNTAGIKFIIQLEPFVLSDKDLYDFVFCINQLIDYISSQTNHNHYIELLIKQNKFYIICIIKTNIYIHLSYKTLYINDILKKHDGYIIPFYENHFSGYKLYFKA